MASFTPTQDMTAETKQSRKKDEQVMKDCETRAIRGLCMNEPRPRPTLGHLPF